MTYPTSTDVTAGQATAAAHYNNLRNDALYLGNPVTDSDLLANLLAAYQSGLTLQYLATNKVRVPASASAPVRLMVGGVMLSAAANVDLAAAPAGGAMTYYVFAVRTAGSTTFTLAINASATETATTRLIGQFYWNSTALTLLQSKPRLDILAQTYDETAQVCQGRLTLTSAAPVTTSDVLAATMLYFTPFMGNYVSLWEAGVGWRTWYFSELSLNLAGYTAGKNFDIFLYSKSGTLTLESLVWTSDSVRATNVLLQDGRYVKSGDATRLYLGTIRTTAVTGQCEDSVKLRFVWNYYNRKPRKLLAVDPTGTWTYTLAAFRAANGNTTDGQGRVSLVVGLSEDTLKITRVGEGANSSTGNGAAVGIGVDAATTNSSDFSMSVTVATANGLVNLRADLVTTLSPGYHYLQSLEYADTGGTFTWYGTMSYIHTGLVTEVLA